MSAPSVSIKVFNPAGRFRVVVTKAIPGDQWIKILTRADCRIEVADHDGILDTPTIKQLIGSKCDGVIGQLTERWSAELFEALKAAGGTAFSNYAVGFNNVDVAGATAVGIPVGNTPGVLTETTGEMALALVFAAARRIAEADTFMRSGQFKGWEPQMFLGKRLHGGVIGIVGMGRIGFHVARSLMLGQHMSCLYVEPAGDCQPLHQLCEAAKAVGVNVTARRVDLEELMACSDVVSIHCNYTSDTHHLVDAKQLALMKKDAILINTSRGQVVDEVALVAHLQANPDFRCGLDVFEHEPSMVEGLAACANAVVAPHIASATIWTRGGMAALAAANVAGILQKRPLWNSPDFVPFVDDAEPPLATPSIVNAKEVGFAPQDSSLQSSEPNIGGA